MTPGPRDALNPVARLLGDPLRGLLRVAAVSSTQWITPDGYIYCSTRIVAG